MSFSFSSSEVPRKNDTAMYSYNEAWFALKTALKANGWTVPRSGDGTTYSSSSDLITSSAVMYNPLAWFVIQQPSGGAAPYAGTRQFCVQCTALGYFRVKYSYNTAFTGGSPTATKVPSAAGENIILGSGTDASPGGDNGGYAQDAGCSAGIAFHIATGSTLEGFSWVISTRTNGGTETMFFDAMQANSYPSQDVDPYLMSVANPGATVFLSGIFGSNKRGLGGASFTSDFNPVDIGHGADILYTDTTIGISTINNTSKNYPTMPICWYSDSTYWKGISTLFLLPTFNMAKIHLLTDVGGNVYLAAGSINPLYPVIFPWSSSVAIFP